MPFDSPDDPYFTPDPSPPRRSKSTTSRLPDLIDFAKQNKLVVGSTTGGRHNTGSKHYSGNAIDIKGSGAFDDDTVKRLSRSASERGLLVRDERRRPPRQKVWGGPHLHIEATDSAQERDPYFMPDAPARRAATSTPSPQLRGTTGANQRPPTLQGATIKPMRLKAWDVTGSVGGQQPATIASLRQSDQAAIKKLTESTDAHFNELKRKQALLERQYSGPERANIRHQIKSDDELRQQAELAVSEQMAMEGRRPEIDAIKNKLKDFATQAEAANIASGSKVRSGGAGRMAQSVHGSLANSGVQAGNLLQFLTRGRAGQDLTDKMRLAQIALAELEEEDPEKGWIAAAERTLPGAAVELAKMTTLSRVPVAGRATLPGLGVLAEADKGPAAAIRGGIEGEAFHRGFQAMSSLPKTAKFVAGTTVPAAIGIAAGEDPKKAILSNTAFGAMAVVGPKGRKAERGRNESTILPKTEVAGERQAQTQDASPRVETGRVGTSATVAADAQSQTGKPVAAFQHKDFGLVRESETQSGVSKGQVRVVDEQGTEHVILKPKGTGAGNIRAIPVKPAQPGLTIPEGTATPIAAEPSPSGAARREAAASSPTERIDPSSIRVFRGEGEPRAFTGEYHGDAVYGSTDLIAASKHGRQGEIGGLALKSDAVVIDANSSVAKKILTSGDPSRVAKEQGIDAIHNPTDRWTGGKVGDGVSPQEVIVYNKAAARKVPLTASEKVDAERYRGIAIERYGKGDEALLAEQIALAPKWDWEKPLTRDFIQRLADQSYGGNFLKAEAAANRLRNRIAEKRSQSFEPTARVEPSPSSPPAQPVQAETGVREPWQQTKAEFYGDSPTVYHGTTVDFDVFRPRYRKAEQIGFGIHFTPQKEFAAKYANDPNVARKGKSPRVIEAQLNIKNPLRADEIVREGSPEFELAKKLAGSKLMTQKDEGGKKMAYLQNAIDSTSPQRAERLIREAGYDGVIYKAKITRGESPGFYSKHGEADTYVVFDDAQVNFHRKQVESALVEGKSVPPEVLADYPDLQKVASAPEAVQTTPAEPLITKPREPSTTAAKPDPYFEPEPSTTAPKDAAMQADREALGLPELERVPRISADEVLTKAKAANAASPRQPDTLIDQALAGGKNFNNVETMQVNLRAQEIKNRIAELNREIADATDPQVIAEKGAEQDGLIDQFGKISEAQDMAGAEWSRAGTARQRAINQDYSLEALIAGAKKARKGRDLTTEERTTIKEQHAKIADLETKLAEANDRATKVETEKAVNRIKRDVARETRRAVRGEKKLSLDDEAAQIKDLIAQEWKKVGGQGIHGMAAVDPEGKMTKLVVRLAKNRLQANVGLKAEALVDDVHGLLKDVMDIDKRQVRDMISGYGKAPKGDQRSPEVKQLAGIRVELKKLSAQEDIVSGKKLSPRDKARQTQLTKQETELSRRMDQGDFSPKAQPSPVVYSRETMALTKQLEGVKLAYGRANYKATRGRFGMITDEMAKAANVPHTLKTIGDISAVFRQGGFYSLTHPIAGFAKPTKAMIQSFTERGYRNVQHQIKSDPAFETLKKGGVEFTGVDKADPNLSHREEGFFGGETIDLLAAGKANPLRVVKGVKNFSQRTYVSFLDAQRLHMGKVMLKGLTDPGIIARTLGRVKPATRGSAEYKNEVREISKLINIGTGRGDIPKWLGGKQGAPVLNVLMFAPRLLASRVQLLNNMINPVKMARMPRAARAQMIQDNVKFLAATAVVMKLAEAAGGTVNRDPDDADFLKIRFGSTTYDTLTGLQQPLRYIINMKRAATGYDEIFGYRVGGEEYSGKSMKQMTSPFEPGSFTRSKASPLAGLGIERITGSDFMGRKRSTGQQAAELATPLAGKDFYEAMKKEGLIGLPKAAPALAGIGVQTYDQAPEKAKTHGEKLTRKLGFHPDKARTDEEIDKGRKLSDLRARSRRGEDVSKEIQALPERQQKVILGARGRTRLQEDFKRLSLKDALRVYGTYDQNEKASVREILESKSSGLNVLPLEDQEAVKNQLEAIGMTPGRKAKQPREPRKARQAQQSYVFQ